MQKLSTMRLVAASVALAGGWSVRAWADSAEGGAEQQQLDRRPPVTEIQEVVVTARRKNEYLENVPVTDSVVTGTELKDMALFSGKDLNNVVPGLDISPSPDGLTTTISLRGASVNGQTTANPTVDTYLNEVPIDSRLTSAALYDINQIEVLRGPQGTLRGRPSPSGALTLSTVHPDLESFGGDLSLTGATFSEHRSEAALNVPIINEKFAVRVAGIIDDGEGNMVRSINNPAEPYLRDYSYRVSLRIVPIDDLDINVMYQDYTSHAASFSEVEGSGFPAGNPLLPAGYNGPVLASGQRLAVAQEPSIFSERNRLLSGQLDWDFGSHRVTYIGSETWSSNLANKWNDDGNFIPAARTLYGPSATGETTLTQELRLETVSAKIWDYGVGVFFSRQVTNVGYSESPTAFEPGAFGQFGTLPDINAYNPAYSYSLAAHFREADTNRAIYANSTFHVTSTTDFFVGARFQHLDNAFTATGSVVNGLASTPIPSVACSMLGPTGFPSTNYPGFCDVGLPNAPAIYGKFLEKASPWVYNASLTQHLTPAIIGYLSFGHSFRPEADNPGFISTDPRVQALSTTKPETSNSFELGTKSQWLNRRLTLNFAGFYQRFNNFIYTSPNVPYFSNVQGGVTKYVFPTTSVDATVKGIDADLKFVATSNLSLSGSYSLARGNVSGSVPCTNVTPTADNPVVYCAAHGALSAEPTWSASLQSEYHVPISSTFEAYARGLVNYKPRNPNAYTDYTAASYTLVNLFLGVRGGTAGNWDLSFFVRNLFNVNETLSRDNAAQLPPYGAGASPVCLGPLCTPGFGTTNTGYFLATQTLPRQFGVTLRYRR